MFLFFFYFLGRTSHFSLFPNSDGNSLHTHSFLGSFPTAVQGPHAGIKFSPFPHSWTEKHALGTIFTTIKKQQKKAIALPRNGKRGRGKHHKILKVNKVGTCLFHEVTIHTLPTLKMYWVGFRAFKSPPI